MIHPPVKRSLKSGESLSALVDTVDKEHRRLLARKSIIEKRKEEHERQLFEMVYPFDIWNKWWFLVHFYNYYLKLREVFILFSWNLKEREEEAKRLKLQKITEEAEQRRLASEFEQMKNQRILREIEERELQEAQALLLTVETNRKKGKRPVLEGVC